MRLVPHDRPAEASGSLFEISPGLRQGLSGNRIRIPVVLPKVRVQSRVLDAPNSAAMELIRPRLGLNLNLSAATSHLGIHRCEDHLHFADKIGMNLRP